MEGRVGNVFAWTLVLLGCDEVLPQEAIAKKWVLVFNWEVGFTQQIDDTADSRGA